MASKRHRDFPVTDESGRYIGMISRRNLLGAKGKPVILVDHNERNQAAEGIEHAEIREIIDHHRIGAVETISPVFFRNQPLGCTATIIYQMFHENAIEIDRQTAQLLCSAIVSDTLLFRSPTCTETDRQAALDLAETAGLDIDQLAEEMFSAGSNLKGKTVEEIFYQDFKRFVSGGVTFGVGQIIATNRGDLENLESELLLFMESTIEKQNLDMVFFMLTNVLTQSTGLICAGKNARETAEEAFRGQLDEDFQKACFCFYWGDLPYCMKNFHIQTEKNPDTRRNAILLSFISVSDGFSERKFRIRKLKWKYMENKRRNKSNYVESVS